MDEMNIIEHHIFFIFAFMKFFLMAMENAVFTCFHTVFYSVLCFSHDVITPPHPPHPPFCKQQRNFQRNTIFQPSNIFQDSTSSNALHMTLLHPPPRPPTPTHPRPPPPPPISIQERPLWYSIKTEGSSKLRGTPSLEPIYIYIHVYIYIYIHII